MDTPNSTSPHAKPNSRLTKCNFLIPQRYILSILSCICVILSQSTRNLHSVAFLFYLNVTEDVTNANNTCRLEEEKSPYNLTDIPSVFNKWSLDEQKIIASSFFITYFVTHLPGGYIADQWGGKHVLNLSMLGCSLCTLLTPVLLEINGGEFAVAVFLRMLNGLFQGLMFPTLNAMLAQWITEAERATVTSAVFSSAAIGHIAAKAVGDQLLLRVSWMWMFYLFGGLVLLWCGIWQLLAYSTPDSHPYIGHEEKVYLREELEDQVVLKKKTIPWKKMLKSKPLWALIIFEIGHDWGWYTIIEYLPKYLRYVLKMNIKNNDVWSAVPFLCVWILAVVFGCIADWAVYDRHADVTLTRKIHSAIGSLGPGLFLLLASLAQCDRLTANILFTIALSLIGIHYSGARVNTLDLAPNFAGIIMALVNGLGTIAGILSPIFVEMIIANNSLKSWQHVFWATFVVFIVGCIGYVVMGSGRTQEWNDIK